ncbi:MAG: 50S ribosomal protein L11 methyltransferase [Bacteroidales bacterium]|nr:50S ribosomal protein L11 methyltransferase [Bacteroidales bacterium]
MKVAITITPFEDWLRDVLTAELGEIGYESFLETDTGFEGFIPEKDFNEKEVTNMLKNFKGNHTFEVQKELIEEQNWNEVWEKNYFKPLVVGGECLVRAPFHKDFPQCKYEIVIEPNMAFGTGNHETTSMMLEAILETDLQGKTVLDMGCGTGILGILASMKGAAEITSIDIDEWSVKGTYENAAFNNIKNLTVKKGDASLLGNEKYDFIFANIHKNVLMNDLPVYSKSLKPNGKLFISGFYTEDIPDLKTKAEQAGLKETGFKAKNNWAVSVFEKTFL